MYHHELWPTSVSHPFSSLNSSLAVWYKTKFGSQILATKFGVFLAATKQL